MEPYVGIFKNRLFRQNNFYFNKIAILLFIKLLSKQISNTVWFCIAKK